MQPGLGAGDAVAVVPDGKDAGVYQKPLLDEDLQGPQRLLGDRETGGPVGRDRLADGLLQHVARPPQVGTKLLWRLLVDQTVPVAVRADLVPAGMDLADQFGMTLADPAENEERGLHPVAIEQLENAVGVGLDAAFPAVPLVAADVFLKGRDLEIILDVDGEGVEDCRRVLWGLRRLHEVRLRRLRSRGWRERRRARPANRDLCLSVSVILTNHILRIRTLAGVWRS